MIDITKDNLFKHRVENITKIKNKSSKADEFIQRNKVIILLVTSFVLLAISNGFLIYNFFRILSKL